MKKLLTYLLFFALVACTSSTRKTDSEEKEQYITNKKNSHLIDLCDRDNMPRFPWRPKLLPRELKNLTQAQMDKRIQEHIDALDKHIDTVEGVVVETRKRVELCR